MTECQQNLCTLCKTELFEINWKHLTVQKMSSGFLKNVIDKMGLEIIYFTICVKSI